MSLMKTLSSYFKMILTLIFGLIGSIMFIYLNLPLPWLLGSIFIISILIQFKNNYIEKPSHIFSTPARIIIGLVIGSAFTPEVLDYLNMYIFSILLIIPYTIITIICGMYYYNRFLSFDKKTAFLSSMPGGVIEMVIIGEQIKANISKITLVQSSRLFFIVTTLPFIIQYIFHLDISGNQIITIPLVETNLKELFILSCVGVIGSFIAIKLNISAAYLIGPMILSILIHSNGLIQTKIPDELIKFVQVILGTIIGFTFKGVDYKTILQTLIATLGHFIILALISIVFISLTYYLFDFPVVSILLAFSPGGQAEINLIAILVTANIPYITLHHIIRLFIVMNIAPFIAKNLK